MDKKQQQISFSASWSSVAHPSGGLPQMTTPHPWSCTPNETPYHPNPFAEIARLKAENEQLKIALLIDPITGLSSRVGFNTKFEAIIAHKLTGRHNSGDVAIIRMDLDGFKPINDNYGHQAGDKYFEIFGQRMKHFFRGDDVVARLGGDEFAILAVDTDTQSISKKMEAIFEASKSWNFDIMGNKIPFRGFSYGISSTNDLTEKLPAPEAMAKLDHMADQKTNLHKQRADKAQTSERRSAESIHVRNLAL
ncbi:MAG: hypothetical protein AUJ12_00800 [Alphaproteobacteria bacterium CG1_02_46_17]|nr:MAG: hypothetical protein AUJ12_00800 [Alphaproteobacteria bacterium CG1_02_46_17]